MSVDLNVKVSYDTNDSRHSLRAALLIHMGFCCSLALLGLMNARQDWAEEAGMVLLSTPLQAHFVLTGLGPAPKRRREGAVGLDFLSIVSLKTYIKLIFCISIICAPFQT